MKLLDWVQLVELDVLDVEFQGITVLDLNWDAHKLDWRIQIETFPARRNLSPQEVVLLSSRVKARIFRHERNVLVVACLLDEHLKHRVGVLPLNMHLKFRLLHKLAALVALKLFLWALLEMDIHIALLDAPSAVVWAGGLEVIDQLLQAHVGLEAHWECFLAARTFADREDLEALLTDDRTTLHAIERYLRQIEANDAFQLVEGQLLGERVGVGVHHAVGLVARS